MHGTDKKAFLWSRSDSTGAHFLFASPSSVYLVFAFVAVIVIGWVASDASLTHHQFLNHFMYAHLFLQVTVIPGTGTMVCKFNLGTW